MSRSKAEALAFCLGFGLLALLAVVGVVSLAFVTGRHFA